jgi:hypothetical protein
LQESLWPHAAQLAAVGSSKVETFADPNRISVCHCLACQLRTGSVFSAQARFARSDTRIEGRSSQYVRMRDSGEKITFNFCPDCGATVWRQAEGRSRGDRRIHRSKLSGSEGLGLRIEAARVGADLGAARTFGLTAANTDPSVSRVERRSMRRLRSQNKMRPQTLLLLGPTGSPEHLMAFEDILRSAISRVTTRR